MGKKMIENAELGCWTKNRQETDRREELPKTVGRTDVTAVALRTRRICESGAAAYLRFWKMILVCYLLGFHSWKSFAVLEETFGKGGFYA